MFYERIYNMYLYCIIYIYVKLKKTQIRLQLMAENISLVKIIILRNLFLLLLYNIQHHQRA